MDNKSEEYKELLELMLNNHGEFESFKDMFNFSLYISSMESVLSKFPNADKNIAYFTLKEKIVGLIRLENIEVEKAVEIEINNNPELVKKIDPDIKMLKEALIRKIKYNGRMDVVINI